MRSSLLNLLVWACAGLNAWFLIAGTGGWWNAVSLAICVGSGLYGLAVMAR